MQEIASNDRGFILVAVLVTLLLLVVIGISATTTTTVELQIAGNDKVSKQTFYGADGGAELGSQMVEENVACANGFTGTQGDGSALINGTVDVPAASLAFGQNTVAKDPVSDASRDMFYPANYTGNQPHTDISAGGPTKYFSGSAIQMVSGYEGKGKGAAAGGAYINFTINSLRIGQDNSQAEVQILYRHVVGLEGTCNY